MTHSDSWHERRRTGIGGSDAAAILGISPWSSALQVYLEKRGEETPDESDASERMVWGQRLERTVLAGYQEDTGIAVRAGGFRRSKTHPWAIGNLDGIARDRIVEVKVTDHMGAKWDDGPQGIPPHYYAQVQHYLMVASLTLADVAVLERGNRLHVRPIEWDQAFCEEMMQEEETLWQRVLDGDPPPPDGSASARQALRSIYPQAAPLSEADATPLTQGKMTAYLVYRQEQKAIQQRMDVLANEIRAEMGEAERLIGNGAEAVWKETAGRTDWKALARSYAPPNDIIANHTKPPTRGYFRVNEKES